MSAVLERMAEEIAALRRRVADLETREAVGRFQNLLVTGNVGVGTTPVYKLDVYGPLALRGSSAGAKLWMDVRAASYTDNAVKDVFSLKIAAGQMWCGEITLSTHRGVAGDYGGLSRYWLWAYRDADGIVRQNVIQPLDNYTVTAQVLTESLTNAWSGDTLTYMFQRDHDATPLTRLTVMVDGFAYGVSDMQLL